MTRVVVIGGGGAALRAALAAAERGARVTLVSKGKAGASGCTHAIDSKIEFSVVNWPMMDADTPSTYADDLETGIMEALVFGALAGAGAAAARVHDAQPALPAAYARPSRHGIDRLTEWRRRLQTEMDDILAVRDRARLAGLETRLAGNLDALERGGLAGETPAAARALHELRSALATSLEVVRASLRREHDLGLLVTR